MNGMHCKRRIRGAVTLAVAVLVGGTPLGSRAADPIECGVPPTVVAAIAPSFPDLPRRARISGTAVVMVDVDHLGNVSSAAIGSSKTMNPLFADPALEAAKKWQFNPAVNCDSRSATLTFDFKRPVKEALEAGTVFRPPFTIEILVEAVRVDTSSTGRP